jgi:hypothetical protein
MQFFFKPFFFVVCFCVFFLLNWHSDYCAALQYFVWNAHAHAHTIFMHPAKDKTPTCIGTRDSLNRLRVLVPGAPRLDSQTLWQKSRGSPWGLFNNDFFGHLNNLPWLWLWPGIPVACVIQRRVTGCASDGLSDRIEESATFLAEPLLCFPMKSTKFTSKC